MSTNYDWEINRCEHCGRSDSIHLGKRSSGWVFLVHIHPFHDLNTWADIKEAISEPGAEPIYDEYGRRVDANDFIALVEDSYTDPGNRGHGGYPEHYRQDAQGYWVSEGDFC